MFICRLKLILEQVINHRKYIFGELLEQCSGGKVKYGGIKDKNLLLENMKMNCIPQSIFNMEIDSYEDYLNERRILMAQKIKEYYFTL